MKLLEPRRLFQVIGLAACGIVAIPVLVDFFYQLPSELAKHPGLTVGWNRQAALILMTTLPIACVLGFAAAFWRTTELGARGVRNSKPALVLLIVQVLLAFMTSTDFLFIVAAEAPFVLEGRRALAWLAGQCITTAGFAAFAAATGNFSPVDGLTHTPQALVVSITILDVAAWIVFAFCLGYLVVRAETGRQLLGRRHAELLATQWMLADSTRMGERLRISRELHDAMGHRLAALNIHLELASRLTAGPPAAAVGDAHEVARMLLAEVREVVSDLREGRQIDLGRAIKLLTHGVARPQIHLTLTDDLDSLDPAEAHALFRCVQETITNAIRHSGANNLWIEIAHSECQWRLCVRDDGRGDRNTQEGNGLRGIRERIEQMGGTLEIETQPGRGFRLCGTIPTPKVLA
jgi:two-component system, NarL family, sensor histidine kinase DesK